MAYGAVLRTGVAQDSIAACETQSVVHRAVREAADDLSRVTEGIS